MRILIAADMEGITGVSNWDQVSPTHADYRRFQRLMTQDVNAAIQGAAEAGADEFLVTDGHGSARNILLDDLDPRARLQAGSPSPLAMVQGIGMGVDAAMFVGYHARAGTQNAILDHTWSGRCVANVWLNGQLVGETGLNAAVCGHFDVPVIMISGDQQVCKEAIELLGPVEIAVIKTARGRQAAECLSPAAAHHKICEAAGRSIARLRKGEAPEPVQSSPPVGVAVGFNYSVMADRASLMPGTVRQDGRRVEYQAEDMLEAYRAFRAMVSLAQE